MGCGTAPGALSGNTNVNIAPGSVAAQTLWIYGEITNGPADYDNTGPDGGLINGIIGTITETANGVHGDMSVPGNCLLCQ